LAKVKSARPSAVGREIDAVGGDIRLATGDNSPRAVSINKSRVARPVSLFWKKDIVLEKSHRTLRGLSFRPSRPADIRRGYYCRINFCFINSVNVGLQAEDIHIALTLAIPNARFKSQLADHANNEY
jgi:hypothetical protein